MEGECKRSSLHGGASSLLNRRRTSGEGGPGGRATRWREKDGEKGAAWVGSRTARSRWLWALLWEAAARAHSRGGLANMGGWCGAGDAGRRGAAQPIGETECKRERGREAGWQWGTNMWAYVAQCRATRFKLDLSQFKV
jgi:hypothetical protein